MAAPGEDTKMHEWAKELLADKWMERPGTRENGKMYTSEPGASIHEWDGEENIARMKQWAERKYQESKARREANQQ